MRACYRVVHHAPPLLRGVSRRAAKPTTPRIKAGQLTAQALAGATEADPDQRDVRCADRGLAADPLAARSAASIRPVSTGPVVPSSAASCWAALTWATISSSSIVVDSGPELTENRCSPAAGPKLMAANRRRSLACTRPRAASTPAKAQVVSSGGSRVVTYTSTRLQVDKMKI